jgi:hypothetical protein
MIPNSFNNSLLVMIKVANQQRWLNFVIKVAVLHPYALYFHTYIFLLVFIIKKIQFESIPRVGTTVVP